MEDAHNSPVTASSSRYWQAYPSTAYEHQGGNTPVETWARQRQGQGQGERSGVRHTQGFPRSHPLDQRHEIRPTARVRESPPLVPTSSAAMKRENVQIFEQRMASRHGLEQQASVNHLLMTTAPLQRYPHHLERQWKREPIDQAHVVPRTTFEPRVIGGVHEHKLHPQAEMLPRRADTSTHRREPEWQRRSQYGPGRIKQEPQAQARVHDGRERSSSSPRYLPQQRLLPSLMERRSLSSLSDTSIPSPGLNGSPGIPPRLALDHKGLFTQARREFPVPRFSFPVDSPSLFSVLGSHERPTASADALVTGRATKVSARTPPVPAVQSSPLPDPKKKVRRTRMCTIEGCVKLVVDHGVCIRHGGGKRCNVEGCECRAQNRGLCWKHGGYTICTVDGCAKRAKSRGMCWSHGGGTQCKQEDCEKIAVSRGRCWAHGGGKRCKVPHCQKPAALRLDDYCAEHHSKNLREAKPDIRQHPRIPTHSADVGPAPHY